MMLKCTHITLAFGFSDSLVSTALYFAHVHSSTQQTEQQELTLVGSFQ